MSKIQNKPSQHNSELTARTNSRFTISFTTRIHKEIWPLHNDQKKVRSEEKIKRVEVDYYNREQLTDQPGKQTENKTEQSEDNKGVSLAHHSYCSLFHLNILFDKVGPIC